MISLPTAKLLLFVALCLGPKYTDSNHTVLITSTPDNCIWTQEPHGWNLAEKHLPTPGWTATGLDVSTSDLNDFGAKNRPLVHAILHHDWSHDSILVLANGDREEKQGTKVFYIVNAGAANEKVYTILTMENGFPH